MRQVRMTEAYVQKVKNQSINKVDIKEETLR